MLRTVVLKATTDSGGDATVTAEMPAYGILYAVAVSNGDLATTADLTLSYTGGREGVDTTLLTLTNVSADKVYLPRVLEHDNAGADLTTYDRPLVDGYLKLVVAQGGDTKTGTIAVHYIGD